MRITRETLIQTARNHVAQRVRSDRSLMTVYAVGSLLSESPLLGGTTDIDLVFVHNDEPSIPREIVRLSPEVTLDIAHLPQSLYRQPRHLRLDAWVGASLCKTRLILHDTQHWFEFTQSSVSAQFNLPGNIMARALKQAEAARQSWFALPVDPADHARNLLAYFKTIELAANAVANLTGIPLTERRFLLAFPERAQAIDKPGLFSALLGLMGATNTSSEQVKTWLPQWSAVLHAVEGVDNLPIRLSPYRRAYYERACDALAADTPAAALWPLMRTWTLALTCLPHDDPHRGEWQQACAALDLDEKQLGDRLSALDTYLDTIDETLEAWGKANGA
jgi:hypothetical protein